MDINKLIIGGTYGFIAQILTFLQLQGNIRYNWFEKYPYYLLVMSIPISWLFIQSVKYLVDGYNGEIWPGRLIGFCISIFVFTLMGYILFKEPITLKIILSLILAFGIVAIQVWMK